MRFKIRNHIIKSFIIISSSLVFFLNMGEAEDDNTQLAQMASGGVSVPASDLAATEQIEGGMAGKVSLDLRNIDVIDALKFLAMKASANIITTKSVAGRITLMVDNVPVQDIFDIMLRSNGLAYTKQGDIYNVMTEDEYRALFGKRFSDIRKVKIFRIKYAIPEQTFAMMDALKSEIGRVLVEQDSGTALVMDTPDRIDMIQDAIGKLEQKNLVKVFTLKYAKAKEVEDQLKPQLDAKRVGSIKSDERSNQLIVQSLPERMPDIERLIAALDVKTKEVLIDALIVKVKLSDELSEGVEWEGIAQGTAQFGSMTYAGSYPFSVLQGSTSTWMSREAFRSSIANSTGIGAIPFSGNTAAVDASAPVKPGEKMHIGIVNKKRDIDLILKYMQSLGKTQILSNPKIAVINNQEARIHVGEKQAYVTTTTTTGQTTSTVSEQVTFVDVGIQLSVTPTINDEGYVTMKIKPEVSSVVSTLVTPSGNKIPIIDSSMAETTVMVKDDSTIVIGGLRKDEKTSAYDQIPFLGKIPVIGYLFKTGSKKTERTELLVMLTPHIVEGDKLMEGNERNFSKEPGKQYQDYNSMDTQADYTPPEEKPEDVMKPYKEYSNVKDEEPEEVTIKE